MSPIAPRYRGPDASSDDSQPALSPILTIPNLAPPEEDVMAFTEVVGEDTSPEPPKAEADSEWTEVEPMQPVLGSMQESIKRITETATKSLKLGGNNRSFNPVETVRGVLPGIVISISIICLWWIIGRSSPAPLRQDIARESQHSKQTIDPIANDPLRANEQVVDAADNSPPAIAAETNRDEQLFDQVPFINRPTNEAVSQSDTTQEAPTAVPPPSEGPQAGTRPAPSRSGIPQSTQSGIANAETNGSSADNQANQRRTQGVSGRAPVSVADRSTEFEWQRGTAGQPSADPRRDGGTEQRRDRQVTAQRNDRDPRFDDRQPQRPYSYQQTDPSTYKDPVYNVPPVARRGQPAQR